VNSKWKCVVNADEPQSHWLPFVHSPSAVDDVLSGTLLLREALRHAPRRSAARDAVIVSPEMAEPPVLLVRRGMAYSSTPLVNGRRAIPDLFLTGDIIGVEHAVTARSSLELRAADGFSYSVLIPTKLRELMANYQVALSVTALLTEERRRRERHLIALTRSDARARIAGFLLGIYERLWRHGLITQPCFSLPLTQDQIADHVGLTTVHVSRTLGWLHKEQLVLVARRVVIIADLVGLRRVAAGDDPVDETVGDELLGESGDRTVATYPAPGERLTSKTL
jgi:CRP-like cAMP-binding protein